MGEIEKALKQISDILLEECCAQVAAKEGKEQYKQPFCCAGCNISFHRCADMPVKKDEKMSE